MIMIKFFKKYHKWLGVILAYVILSFVFSGIILNHRDLFSNLDVSRKLLPPEYRYVNWNNAAVKSTLKISPDSILIYGNIGIWLTDSTFSDYSGFTEGFPRGSDNRKIFQMLYTSDKELLAATLSGLYRYTASENKWKNIPLPIKENNTVSLVEKEDTIIILTRSVLLKTTDLMNFTVSELPPPEGYDNKVGLFKTLWVIHSGEIYGKVGKLLIDFAGLIFAFLTITGFIIFVNKIILKRPGKTPETKSRLKGSNRWNIKWHNKLGWITIVLLIINTTTGMFLRPPLLIAIANSKVGKIPYTELATPNPWFDLLRRICYDEDNNRFIVAAMEGVYYSDDNFGSDLKMFPYQPPVSVMGVTVLEKVDSVKYLIGSFEGLFEWNSMTGETFDYVSKKPYTASVSAGRPIGDNLVSGYTRDFAGREYFFDYNTGASGIESNLDFPSMPQKIIDSEPMSLWNAALEFHTGRIYQSLTGPFYVLIVPLTGLFVLFILISGFIVWLSPKYKPGGHPGK